MLSYKRWAIPSCYRNFTFTDFYSLFCSSEQAQYNWPRILHVLMEAKHLSAMIIWSRIKYGRDAVTSLWYKTITKNVIKLQSSRKYCQHHLPTVLHRKPQYGEEWKPMIKYETTIMVILEVWPKLRKRQLIERRWLQLKLWINHSQTSHIQRQNEKGQTYSSLDFLLICVKTFLATLNQKLLKWMNLEERKTFYFIKVWMTERKSRKLLQEGKRWNNCTYCVTPDTTTKS